MRVASRISVSDDASDDQRNTKCFTSEEFRRVQRSIFFLGCVSFWRQLECLSDPESRTRFHAMGVLREMARSSLADCEGAAYSPEHAEALAFCGFAPAGVRSPGSSALEDK